MAVSMSSALAQKNFFLFTLDFAVESTRSVGPSGETDERQGGSLPPWPVISKFLGPLSPHCWFY